MHLNTTDLDFRHPKAHFSPQHGRPTHALTRFPPSSLKWAHGPWGRAWEGPGPIGPTHVGAKNWNILSGVAWRLISCCFPNSFFLREHIFWGGQSARIVFYSRKRMPLFVASDGSAAAQGASYENKKPQLGICQANGPFEFFRTFDPLESCVGLKNALGYMTRSTRVDGCELRTDA